MEPILYVKSTGRAYTTPQLYIRSNKTNNYCNYTTIQTTNHSYLQLQKCIRGDFLEYLLGMRGPLFPNQSGLPAVGFWPAGLGGAGLHSAPDGIATMPNAMVRQGSTPSAANVSNLVACACGGPVTITSLA